MDTSVRRSMAGNHHDHHHHISVMELGHLLTRSGLTYSEVSSKVCHDSFCQLGKNISLPWVIYYEPFYLHVVSSFSYIPVICLKLVLFLIPLQFVYLWQETETELLALETAYRRIWCCAHARVGRLSPCLVPDCDSRTNQAYSLFIFWHCIWLCQICLWESWNIYGPWKCVPLVPALSPLFMYLATYRLYSSSC